jgi:hypothetical protein
MRKAQHEIIGFILIIVLVVVVSMIFLALYVRQKPSGVATESKQVSNLLHSMLQYTTDCAIYVPQYESLRDLIKSCYNSEKCSDGISTCQKLKDMVNKLLESAQPNIGAGEMVIKGYEFNASYVSEQRGFFMKPREADLVYISKGKCSKASNSIGSQEFLPLDVGNIKVSLKFCY